MKLNCTNLLPFLGTRSNPAGWHCSYCFTPSGIRKKLTDAQNGDFPRWGDYPEKLNLTYIAGLIRRGFYFDEKKMKVESRSLNNVKDARNFCPEFDRHDDRFRYQIKRVLA